MSRQPAPLRFIERRLGITASGAGLAALAVAGWVVGRMLVSPPLFLMVYGMLMLLGLAYVLGRRKLAVEAERSDLPARVRVGQTVDAELMLRARRRLTSIVVEETLPEELGPSVRVSVPLLAPGHEVAHPYALNPGRRGVYRVGPLVAEWSDPFGLTRRREVIAEPVQMIVHPSVEPVNDRIVSREWEDPPVRPPVSKRWPTGFEFYGMRDYVAGDDPRRIAWRATARTSDLEDGDARLLVREAEQGITDRVQVFVDTDREYHSPGDPSGTFETAVRVAASLGVKHLEDGFSVSLDANTQRLARDLRGVRHRVALLDQLAALERERAPLVSALDRLLADRFANAHNILVTPHLDADAAARARLLLERGRFLLLVLVVWEDTDPASIHRAGNLGCTTVEAPVGAPLNRVFRRVAAARAR
jgi:uncharacterized protein (DUF58 family)